MFNKLVCLIFGHIEGGKESYTYTLYTYIHRKRCTDIYDSYKTI